MDFAINYKLHSTICHFLIYTLIPAIILYLNTLQSQYQTANKAIIGNWAIFWSSEIQCRYVRSSMEQSCKIKDHDHRVLVM